MLLAILGFSATHSTFMFLASQPVSRIVSVSCKRLITEGKEKEEKVGRVEVEVSEGLAGRRGAKHCKSSRVIR